MRLIWASKRMDTARPATSSSGETIFDPDERRASDLLNNALDSESNRALLCADTLVLMTILLTPSLSPPFRGYYCTASLPRGGPFPGHPPVYSLLAVRGRQPPVSNRYVSAQGTGTLAVKSVVNRTSAAH